MCSQTVMMVNRTVVAGGAMVDEEAQESAGKNNFHKCSLQVGGSALEAVNYSN